jgi:DMSO/TMAO reductase YedYZ heme-binding membrane subunit/uncharacterized protein with FMN-binding domain
MLFLISLAIALIVAFLLGKPLKKYPAAFYVTAAAATAASIIISQADIAVGGFVRVYVLGIFTRGALGAAFWAVVMWTGALPNGSAAIKKLMPVRGELSITAAALTLSHVVTYGVQYISRLVNGRTGSDFAVTSAVSIVMVLIMLPLTVMSFKAVRRKMNAKTWKRIQRLAYVFYALIYVHIMVVFVPRARSGREGYFLNVLVYSAVFIGYAVMRLEKLYLTKKKPKSGVAVKLAGKCAAIALVYCAAVFSYGEAPAGESPPPAGEPVTFTFTPSASAASESRVTTEVTEVAVQTTGAAAEVVTEPAETETEAVGETTEAVTEEVTPEQTEAESPAEETEPAEEVQEEVQTEPVTEVVYRYRNGEFEGSAMGYTGTVHVRLTIENDCITSMTAWADDDDPEYFSDAMNKVIPQIAANVSADGVDACSGATFSSKGIIEAANNALEKALSE